MEILLELEKECPKIKFDNIANEYRNYVDNKCEVRALTYLSQIYVIEVVKSYNLSSSDNVEEILNNCFINLESYFSKCKSKKIAITLKGIRSIIDGYLKLYMIKKQELNNSYGYKALVNYLKIKSEYIDEIGIEAFYNGIINSVSKLPMYEKEIIYLAFGFYDGVEYDTNAISQLLNKSRFKISEIILNIVTKIIVENNIPQEYVELEDIASKFKQVRKRKNKTLMELFSNYNMEEILESLKELDNRGRSIIYRFFGTELDKRADYGTEKSDYLYWYGSVRPRIIKIMDYNRAIKSGNIDGKIKPKKLYSRRGRSFYEVHAHYSKEDVDFAYSLLKPDEQTMLLIHYNGDLNSQETNNLDKEATTYIYRTINPNIEKTLENISKLDSKKRHDLLLKTQLEYARAIDDSKEDMVELSINIYGMLSKYNSEQINQAITLLPNSYRYILLRIFGKNLNSDNFVQVNKTILRLYNELVIPKIIEIIEMLKKGSDGDKESIINNLKEIKDIEDGYYPRIFGNFCSYIRKKNFYSWFLIRGITKEEVDEGIKELSERNKTTINSLYGTDLEKESPEQATSSKNIPKNLNIRRRILESITKQRNSTDYFVFKEDTKYPFNLFINGLTNLIVNGNIDSYQIDMEDNDYLEAQIKHFYRFSKYLSSQESLIVQLKMQGRDNKNIAELVHADEDYIYQVLCNSIQTFKDPKRVVLKYKKN